MLGSPFGHCTNNDCTPPPRTQPGTLGHFISPQSERSELGAFYFCQGVLSGYCCMCVSGYCCVWERKVTVIKLARGPLVEGVFKYVANSRAVVTLFDSDRLLLILLVFHYKSMVSSSYNHCFVYQWSVL